MTSGSQMHVLEIYGDHHLSNEVCALNDALGTETEYIGENLKYIVANPVTMITL